MEDFLPRCLDLISAGEVTRRISLYFHSGAVRPLTGDEWQTCEERIEELADSQ